MSTAIQTSESNPTSNSFNMGSFIAAFVAFAVERWLHHGGLSGADDLKAGKKKRKKLQKKHPKNFVQSSLKEFALSYPDTPKEANGSVKKWLLRQITDPKKIWLAVEALGAARGLLGKLGQQSSKGKKKKGNKADGSGSVLDGSVLKPLVDAGVAAIGGGKTRKVGSERKAADGSPDSGQTKEAKGGKKKHAKRA